MRRVALASCIALGIVLLCVLYLSNLSAMGLVSTDEPRYADIGRAMAQSGDWITPRLSGHPWFEKPPLLYWMIAVGFKLGLGTETGPRLPVAAMGLAFLVFFWMRIRTLWDFRTASFSTAILATSAGWLAYSHAAITDTPVAVLFSAAVLLSIEPEGKQPRRVLIAAILGLATLAKSLFPLVLFVPVIVLDYRQLRAWLKPAPILAFAVVSLPWHILCAMRNGREFIQVLFIEHQFGRFTSGAIQHVMPWWYYLPVLLMFLYPWFPLLFFTSRERNDSRIRILLSVVIFGFIFISASVNKLPGYLLPLLPSICVLIGVGFARSTNALAAGANWAISASVVFLGLLPLALSVLPTALATGLRASSIPWSLLPYWLLGGILAGLLIAHTFRQNSLYPAAILVAGCLIWFEISVFPAIDHTASARSLWLTFHPTCQTETRRSTVYGLNYYAGRKLPQCDILDPSAAPVVR